MISFPLIAQETVFFILDRGNSKAPELIDLSRRTTRSTLKLSATIDQSAPHTHFNRGNTYIDLYRFDEALLDYDRITENAPEFAIFNRGNDAIIGTGTI